MNTLAVIGTQELLIVAIIGLIVRLGRAQQTRRYTPGL